MNIINYETPSRFDEVVVDKSANPRRGLTASEIAVKFAKDFPVGTHSDPTRISVEELDNWFCQNGLLVLPPEGVSKKSDAWLGHLQRRHQCLRDLNKASTHPRMRDYGVEPFIAKPRGGMIIIRPPHEQIVQCDVARKLDTVLTTKRTQLRYLMESADWSVLPEHERAIAEELGGEVDLMEANLRNHIDHIRSKFDRLAHKISSAVKRKEIVPQNGGIKAFIEADKTLVVDLSPMWKQAEN